MPDYTGDITGLGTVRLLEAIRKSGVPCRLYQASSSEMFGDAAVPQNERTPLRPCSPYAAAKAYAYWMVRHYRQAYGLFACNGIMFNHESPRRGETFLSRKITRAVANIVAGRQQQLFLGNLTACRDWGYAPEYVEGMWLMLQHNTPLDLVFGTGKAHSVEAFLEEAFGYVDLDWRKYVEIDPRYLRPTDIAHLQADPTSAQQQLGWQTEVAFEDLVRMMVDADLHAVGLPTACPSGNPITGERFAWLKRA